MSKHYPLKVRESVQKAGFKPDVAVDEKAGEAMRKPHDHHAMMVQKGKANELKVKAIASGIIFVIVFLGSFPQWFPWIPDILTNNFLLLALATPVQFWAGWHFYKWAWVAHDNLFCLWACITEPILARHSHAGQAWTG